MSESLHEQSTDTIYTGFVGYGAVDLTDRTVDPVDMELPFTFYLDSNGDLSE